MGGCRKFKNKEYNMGQHTRIHNRFTGYTVADCDCKFCLYYGGKRKGCTIEKCCCEEERAAAIAKERMKEDK